MRGAAGWSGTRKDHGRIAVGKNIFLAPIGAHGSRLVKLGRGARSRGAGGLAFGKMPQGIRSRRSSLGVAVLVFIMLAGWPLWVARSLRRHER